MMSWGKYHNNLKTELQKHPLDRIEPRLALKMYKDEYDRLIEVSPEILKKIIKLFKTKFKKNEFIIKPDIVNKLKPTKIYTMSEEEREYMIKNMDNTTQERTVFDIDNDETITIV